jgi:hypothetical protein
MSQKVEDLQKQIDLLRGGLEYLATEGNREDADPMYLVEMAEHILEEHNELKRN